MRVLVTRPAAQASDWVRALRAAGIEAEALPLMSIAPAADAAELRAAWRALPQTDLVMFVSPNAASCFFEERPEDAAWPAAVTAASPGPGTTRVLRELGVEHIVEPAPDAPQFDSETLWAELSGRDWQDKSVLVVRGASGREWLAQQLQARGATLRFVAAYRRTAPVLSPAESALLAEAIATPANHLWLFSSSEAVGHLDTLAPRADWSGAVALATHPRIAQAARTLGLGRVLEARPSLEAVVGCIQSLAP
jgi:uroporphyrinogen-III synthase